MNGLKLTLLSFEALTRLGGCHTGVWCGVWRPTQLPMCWYCIWAFFFFFFKIRIELGQFDQNWVVSVEFGCIGLWLKQSKQADIGLESCRNQLWMRLKHPKSVIPQFYSEYLLFLLCYLFCFVFLAFFFLSFVNQDHSNVFFKNILIVKIYRKYK